TATGARAGASHTAAAAAPDATVDALFAQAGVIRCAGLGELLDTARLLVEQPLPAGRRIAIVGNAGGVNVLAADAADAAELMVPATPVDLGAAATPEAVRAALASIVDSGGVDAGLVGVAARGAHNVPGVLPAVRAGAARRRRMATARRRGEPVAPLRYPGRGRPGRPQRRRRGGGRGRARVPGGGEGRRSHVGAQDGAGRGTAGPGRRRRGRRCLHLR